MTPVAEERLSANDGAFFVAESDVTPQVTALLTLLETTPSMECLRDVARRAAAVVPRLQCVVDPQRFGVLVRMPHMDPADHVSRVHAADVRTASDLLDVVSALHSQPLPHDRPLWQIVLVSNRDPESGELPPAQQERVAVLWRVHHGISDGIRSMDMFRAALAGTTTPSQGPRSATPGSMRPSLAAAGRAARIVARTQRMAPIPSPLNGTNSPARRLTTVELDRVAMRSVMRREGVGLHDVMVAVLASALRHYHQCHGAPVVRDLRVIVPTNSQPLPNSGSRGNFVDMVWLSLPITEADPIRRLHSSAEALSRARAEGWVDFSHLVPPLVARAPLRLQRQFFSKACALTNAVCTIMPANLQILEVGGQSMARSYAAATLLESHGAGFTFMTAGSAVRGAIVSDPALVPDPQLLAGALHEGLNDLKP